MRRNCKWRSMRSAGIWPGATPSPAYVQRLPRRAASSARRQARGAHREQDVRLVGVPCASANSGSDSLSVSTATASLATSAPRLRTWPVHEPRRRLAGPRSRDCDTTIRRPRARANQVGGERRRRFDVDVLRAPASGGPSRMRQPFFFGAAGTPRLPTRPGRSRSPAAAGPSGPPATSGRSTLSSRSSTRSASAASRRGAHLAHGRSRHRRAEQGFVVHGFHSRSSRIEHSRTVLLNNKKASAA